MAPSVPSGCSRAFSWAAACALTAASPLSSVRQRVALLRTIVQGRQVVLLDEPFGALDYLTRTELQLWLASMWEQFHWTVVLVTHDVPEALLLSDRIYVLGSRPARVRCVLNVDLPRPRGPECLSTPRFAELEEALLSSLRRA